MVLPEDGPVSDFVAGMDAVVVREACRILAATGFRFASPQRRAESPADLAADAAAEDFMMMFRPAIIQSDDGPVAVLAAYFDVFSWFPAHVFSPSL